MATEIVNSNELSFEERLARLEEIVGILEEGRLGLEKSLKLFEEAVAIARSCRTELADAELRISRLGDHDTALEQLACGEAGDEHE
jgi:exodeoxyribonuclease VII small subunit